LQANIESSRIDKERVCNAGAFALAGSLPDGETLAQEVDIVAAHVMVMEPVAPERRRARAAARASTNLMIGPSGETWITWAGAAIAIQNH
jgi:hypothetical protein